MPQSLTNIPKKSVAIFLAADDGALVFDDNDNTYLVIKIADALKKIASNVASLINISKNAADLTNITKNIVNRPFLRMLELPYVKFIRLLEDEGKRLLEDSPIESISISKGSGTLTKIPKS